MGIGGRHGGRREVKLLGFWFALSLFSIQTIRFCYVMTKVGITLVLSTFLECPFNTELERSFERYAIQSFLPLTIIQSLHTLPPVDSNLQASNVIQISDLTQWHQTNEALQEVGTRSVECLAHACVAKAPRFDVDYLLTLCGIASGTLRPAWIIDSHKVIENLDVYCKLLICMRSNEDFLSNSLWLAEPQSIQWFRVIGTCQNPKFRCKSASTFTSRSAFVHIIHGLQRTSCPGLRQRPFRRSYQGLQPRQQCKCDISRFWWQGVLIIIHSGKTLLVLCECFAAIGPESITQMCNETSMLRVIGIS